jgi:hypothetical protein
MVEVLQQKGMKDKEIRTFLERIKNTEEIAHSAIEYFVNGVEPTITVEGYSYDYLRTQHAFTETGAFIMLAFLKLDPKTAMEVLYKHDSLL